MSINFGWWNKDADGKKFEVSVSVHGGNIEWSRKQGHHAPWEPYTPDDDDRVRLLAEADKRLPRRLTELSAPRETPLSATTPAAGGLPAHKLSVGRRRSACSAGAGFPGTATPS